MKFFICVLLSVVAFSLCSETVETVTTQSLLNSANTLERELRLQNHFIKQKLEGHPIMKNHPAGNHTHAEVKKQALKFLHQLHHHGKPKKCKKFTKKSIKFNKKIISDILRIKKLILTADPKCTQGKTPEEIKRYIQREIEKLRKLIKEGCPGAKKRAKKVSSGLSKDIYILKNILKRGHSGFVVSKKNLEVQTNQNIQKMKTLSKEYKKLILEQKNIHVKLYKHSQVGNVNVSPMKLISGKDKVKANKIRKELKETVRNLKQIMKEAPKELKEKIKKSVAKENKKYKTSFNKIIKNK
jgi:hypothetical protein